MSVRYNARVLRPTGPPALSADAPALGEAFEHFAIYIENVSGDATPYATYDATHDTGYMPLGKAASGRGEAALCEMTLETARRICGTAGRGEETPVEAAARAAVNFSKTRFELRAGTRTMTMGPRSLLMGIVNVTPDSFSDGGNYFDTDRAIAHGLKMASEGADIIDVGGCSTRPGAEEIPEEEELRRVKPVVEALAKELDKTISIDSYQPEVARGALEAGATMVNDVTGLHAHPELAKIAAEHGAAIVLMHTQGMPRTMQKNPAYRDLMSEVSRYLREGLATAEAAGVSEDRLAVDPGFGFGKRVEHNLEILRRLAELRSLGVPVMLGTSRKSTIGKVLGGAGVEERAWGTAATIAVGRAAGALMFRVHDVAEMDEVRRMTDAIYTNQLSMGNGQ